VPLPLAIARLIAPITGVAVVIAGAITFCRTWLIRRLARRARGLELLLGPTSLVDSWIDPDARGEVTLHLDTGPAGAERADARVAVQLQPFRYVPDRWEPADVQSPADWVAAGNGSAASRLVVATGRDDLTVDAIGIALTQGVPARGACLDAEIHNLSLALRLATELAVSYPDREINIVCRNDVLADRAVDAILDRRDTSTGSDANAERIAALRSSRIAVIGDDPLCRLVARRLEQEIFEGTATDTSRRFDLHVVSSDPGDRAWYRHGLQHPELFRVTEHPHLRELLAEPAHPDRATSIVAFVAHRDPEDTMREAFEIVASGSTHRAVAPLGAIATPGAEAAQRLVSLDRRDRLNAAVLLGPFRRAAQELAGSSSTDEARRALERRIRIAVRRLVRHGGPGTTWTVEPTTFAGPGATALALRPTAASSNGDPSVRVAVGHLLISGDDPLSREELEGLPSALASAGLSIIAHRPGVARPVPKGLSERSDWSASSGVEVDDDQVDQMAAELHERYRSEAMNAGRPADVPWDDLPDDHRAQNHHAVRFTVEQLRRYGFEVRPEGQLTTAESLLVVDPGQLDHAVVEAMAIDEHDRWARQKRANGFVFGDPDLHPTEDGIRVSRSLVDWDDLDDEDRERDRGPIRAMPEVLASAGLVMVDRRDG
jgi:hypothetical protein